MSSIALREKERVPVYLGDQPVEWALMVPANTEKALSCVTESMVPKIAVGTPERMFREFGERIEQLERIGEDNRSFLQAVVECNSEVKLMRGEKKDLELDIPRCEPLARSVKHIAAMTYHDQMCDGMNQMLMVATSAAIRALAMGCKYLKEQQLVGEIGYDAVGVCWFFCYRWFLRDDVTARRTTTNTTSTDTTRRSWTRTETIRETDITRRLTQELSYRELRNARWHSVLDRSVRRPARVDQLIKRIPRHLMPYLKIVNGDQIFRRDLERLVHSETRTEVQHNVVWTDPALVLGNVCFAAW